MKTLHAAVIAAVITFNAGAATAQEAGVTPAQVGDWLATQGLSSQPFNENDLPYLRVQDGPLTWQLFFHGCENGVCPSIQFDARFSGEHIDTATVNRWNSEWRFLKAHHVAGAQNLVLVQYDVIHTPSVGLEQFEAHLGVWREMLVQFAIHISPPETAQ